MTTMPPSPDDVQRLRPHRRSRWLISVLLLALVIATVLVALASADDDPAIDRSVVGSPTPTTIEEPPAPIEELQGRARPYRVTVAWSAPTTLPHDGRYEVRRDGTFVAYVDPPAHRLVDDDVVPGETYRYEIRVEAEAGVFSEPASVRVETPLPLLAEARLQGTFDVRSRFTSKSGYGEYEAPGFGWRFRPKCGEGTCDASVQDILRSELHLVLDRTGGTYRGSYTGRFGLECGGTETISSVTIELRVTKARVIDGAWRATRLTGTLTHRESTQLGCRSSSAALGLRAKLYR